MSSGTILPPLGFLAVEVKIHRPPGDPFNPQTWPFPLIHELVPGSQESQVVRTAYDSAFIDRFVAAGNELAEKGCVGIITSCGFLALAQRELAERIPIPVSTSALVQIPSVRALLPKESVVGVLTYDDERLGVAHLEALGVDPAGVRIRGMPADGHLRKVIQEGLDYDEKLMEQEMVDGATRLVEDVRREGKEIGALVLECTQMPPYAESIQKQIGKPVYDVYTMGMWFYSGLVRYRPSQWK
ncbi:hypothetical protein BS50DRAFT_625098 [Corynespora cassiicola Philippines]|uniref:Aspartate/glutamate racemase family protein n=1 Tax=Corynespora cassiicola Philippines TaxID=1448308 RepID=A0A2T2N8B3_CORCC|nr:hypothetical protein BS50DRAFT_625098 [Corynespora cassiicola Philippines]